MQFKHLCLDSIAALHNACLLKISRHIVDNIKTSQALKLGTVHANLKPRRRWCQGTTYAQGSHCWSNHPDTRDQKHGACCQNRNLAVTLFLACFPFNHVDLAYQAEVWPGKFSLSSFPPTAPYALHGATSGLLDLLYLKKVSKSDHPFLNQCSNIIKNGISTVIQKPSEGRCSAHLDSCAERPGSEIKVAEVVGRFSKSAGFLDIPVWYPVQDQLSGAVSLPINLQMIQTSKLGCVDHPLENRRKWLKPQVLGVSTENSNTQGKPSCTFFSLHSFCHQLQRIICLVQRD